MTEEVGRGAEEVRVAVVRCDIISEVCPGVGCLRALREGTESFEGYDRPVRLVGFFTCGGCPGRRIYRLVNTLKRYGVDAVHMSSCILMEKPFTRCPNKGLIRKSIEGLGIPVVEGTHHEEGQHANGKRFHGSASPTSRRTEVEESRDPSQGGR
jgi:predicted metal-binding protein